MRRRAEQPGRAALALVAAALLLISPRAVVADNRPWSGGVGVSAWAARGGAAASGLSAVASLSPGGPLERFGLRLEARTAGGKGERLDRGLFLAGATYAAAASRPLLSISIHGEVGTLAPDPRAAVGGGGDVQLWVVGPLALALGASAHVLIDGLDSELVLAGGIGLRLAR